MSDTREICKSCGQYMPLPTPDIGRLDALTELRAALGRRNPRAGISNPVTPKQLTAIRAIANSHSLNHLEECKAALGCEPAYLSIFAASKFIAYLKRIGTERRAALKRAG
jgi:hypothetical protein